MNWKILAVLLAILTLVACPLFLYFLYQQYSGYIAALLSKYPEPIRPYVDFVPPFWTTIYGQVAFCSLFAIAILWIVHLAYFIKKKHWKTFAVSATIGALLLVSQLGYAHNDAELIQVQTVTPQPQNIIDVLAVLDEEFQAKFPNFDYQTAELAVQSELNKANCFTSLAVTDCFSTTFGIIFEIRKFAYWNSNDAITDTYYLLQEAIAENGGAWDSTNEWYVFNGETIEVNGHLYKIDLLIVFTGQDMDMYGLSPPMWNASIFKWAGHNLIRHELSHQYWIQHCGNLCVMNPTYTLVRANWCGTCEQALLINRNKWVTEYQVTISHSVGGQTNAPAGKYLFRETEITINAISSEGYAFKYWKLDGVTYTSNPINVYMGSDHTLQAYFTQDYATGGRSGGCIKCLL